MLPVAPSIKERISARAGERASGSLGKRAGLHGHSFAGSLRTYFARASGGREGMPGFRMNTQADARTRTGDPFITSEVLYQLSYVGGAVSVAPA